MRRWTRATKTMLCGYDRQCVIQAGEPIRVSTFTGVNCVSVRCGKHAGEPVPDTLDESVPSQPKIRIPSFTSLGKLAADFDPKRRASGERE